MRMTALWWQSSGQRHACSRGLAVGVGGRGVCVCIWANRAQDGHRAVCMASCQTGAAAPYACRARGGAAAASAPDRARRHHMQCLCELLSEAQHPLILCNGILQKSRRPAQEAAPCSIYVSL